MLLKATSGGWGWNTWEWYRVIDGQEQAIPGTKLEIQYKPLTAVEIQGNVYRTFIAHEQQNYFVDDTFSTGGIQFQFKGVVELEGIEVLRLP